MRVLPLVAGVLLWAPAPALADSTTSVNWAGYAAHRSGVRFRAVSAEWRVPAPDCWAAPGYSSMWVGLGGYSQSSNAVEQVGVEGDCSGGGGPSYFAWYELVPSPPRRIPLPVRAGNLMRAGVSVSGRRVMIVLQDLSTRGSFTRTLSPARLDTTSAEWILEAPSVCSPDGQCFALPLDDFGWATFTAAHATTRRGVTGNVTSRWWNATQITLAPHSGRVFSGTAGGGAEALPSSLTAGGSAFSVSYRPSSQTSAPAGPGGQVAGGGGPTAGGGGSPTAGRAWLAPSRLIHASRSTAAREHVVVGGGPARTEGLPRPHLNSNGP